MTWVLKGLSQITYLDFLWMNKGVTIIGVFKLFQSCLRSFGDSSNWKHILAYRVRYGFLVFRFLGVGNGIRPIGFLTV